ncbi:MAG: PH domain-containing protein [Chloroflexota bacterium]
MNAETAQFFPTRRRGLVFNIGLALGLGLLSTALFILAGRAPLGPLFLVYLLAAITVASPTPVLAYRAYALYRSHYQVERNGIRLKWGFREEDIPISEIEWVEYAEDLIVPLIKPRLIWPGAVVGKTEQEGLGVVEFLAAEEDEMVMIGTKRQVYVISPGDAGSFVRAYRKFMEMGSLAPFPGYSNYPSFIFVDIWQDVITRVLLIVTLIFSTTLFVWVGLAIPSISEVSLGFSAVGIPLPPVSPAQLFLLPAVNLLLVAANYLLSVYFFRRSEDHPLVYWLWSANVISSLLFLVAVFFILRAS